MIQYNSKDAYLEIPKGLGNLGGNTGGGGGADVGPLSGSVVELSATTETVAQNLEALSATTQNIASSVGSVNTNLETLSGSVETLSSEVDSISGQTSANTAQISTLSGQVDTLSSSTVNGLQTAQNTANSANTLASSAYTLADSAYTRADAAYNLAESLTGATGGIEKVDVLPANPENGTLVLLHIPSYTATTFYKSSDVNWEAGYNLFNCNGSEQYADGYGKWYGVWKSESEYRVKYRKDTDDRLFADVVSDGTLTAGNDADGSETTTIPDRYELWKYENGEWFQLDREWVYQIGVDGTAGELYWKIYAGVADVNPEYLTIREYDDGGKLREFKPYDFKYYGIDLQASDSRGSEDGNFGWLKISSKRCSQDGINTLVGDKWLKPLSKEIPVGGYNRFGNDDTGQFYYSKDNSEFYFANTGAIDATGYTADLIDKLFTDYNVDGGTIFDYIIPLPILKIGIVDNGETTYYSYPTLSRKEFSSPVTISGYDFYKEITFDYGDFKLAAYYGADESNNAGNVRITFA